MRAPLTASENGCLGVSNRIVLLLTLAVFINYVDRGSLSTAAPLIRGELALSDSRMGVLLSAFFWTYTMMQPIWGWLAQRFGARTIYAIGFSIWALATTLTAFVTGFVSLFFLRLLLGVGESVSFPCTSKILAESTSEYDRGRANGFVSAACGMGPSVGTLIGGILMEKYGWRIGFLIFGLGSVIWLLPWLMSAKSTVPGPKKLNRGVIAYSSIPKQRALWGASLGHFCFNYGYYFVLTWLPLYLVNSRGLSLLKMSMVGAVVYGVFALSAALTGWATDRQIAAGRPVSRVRKTTLVISLLGSAGSMLVCSSVTPEWSGFILGIAGFFFGLGNPQIFAIAQTLSGPGAGGSWMGIQNMVANLAGIAAPIITGWTLEVTGEFYVSFVLTSMILVFGSLSWGLVVPRVEMVDWDQMTPSNSKNNIKS